MVDVYDTAFCSLHVRVSNMAAVTLYQDVLAFEIVRTESGYYADGEDAYDMKATFKQVKKPHVHGEGCSHHHEEEKPKEEPKKEESTKETTEEAKKEEPAKDAEESKAAKKRKRKKKR